MRTGCCCHHPSCDLGCRRLLTRAAAAQRCKENINHFLGGKNFVEDLGSDHSLIIKIICNIEEAFGDSGPGSIGWPEFKMACHYLAQSLCGCAFTGHEANEFGHHQVELGMLFDCFGYYCEMVKLHECGLFGDEVRCQHWCASSASAQPTHTSTHTAGDQQVPCAVGILPPRDLRQPARSIHPPTSCTRA